MTRRELFRQCIGVIGAVALPLSLRVQTWYGTLGQWMYHAEHGVTRLEKMNRLVEVPGSAFSNIPSTFVRYGGFGVEWGWRTRWVGHYETASHRILGWMDRSGRVWWARKP